ncbi:MAG: hypothetical protein AMJ79_04290 [Phycisphaerae bacterium SM23_30]|nr:MAG: hypothetical protein AMJ79_04290 [Phycisphaerae bacterium SM23_30]
MSVRTTAVAGQFYESSPQACRSQLEQMLPAEPLPAEMPPRIISGIVPHAGWVFSGALAGLVFAAVKQQNESTDTFVIFGAVHAVRTQQALLYDAGSWETPLGAIDVDEQLAAAILAEAPDLIIADCNGHRREHSIEVQVPLVQYLFEDARIVPLLIPPNERSHLVGRAAARAIARVEKSVVCIGSTDLTHYGPSYFFTPQGTGPQAHRWAKETNDKFFIDLALAMEADRLVDAAETYSNSCGAGAAAAAIAAARELGAARGYLLDHKTSAEIMAQKFNQDSTDSVGYAALVFG